MIQLRHIRAFRAVVEQGSIRAAARKLGISQPALTKTVRELEEILAVPLVLRSAKGVILTEYGRALHIRAGIIDTEVQRAADEIAQMLGAKGGNVVVGISPLASLLMGAETLGRFWRHYPAGNVRLVEGLFEVLLSGVEQGRLDFSVGPLPPSYAKTSVVVEPLFRTPIVPVVRRGHPLADATSLAELRDAPWMLTSGDASFRELMAKSFADCGYALPPIAVICESFAATFELLIRTDLIAPLTPILLKQDLLQGRITAIKTREPPPFTVTALVRKAGVPLTPLAAALAQEFRRIGQRFAEAAGAHAG